MEELSYVQKCSQKVNGQYTFVRHDDVTEKIHPYLVKHGLVILPSVRSITQEGNRTCVELDVAFVNADDCKDAFSIRMPGYGIDSGDKGPGKAVSYAYKYALLKTFALATGDDPDNDAKASYEPQKCVEFDMLLPEDFSAADKKKMAKFLEHSSKCMNKHVEDVKREACARMPDFIKAFKGWNT